jgi:hypothetical protein
MRLFRCAIDGWPVGASPRWRGLNFFNFSRSGATFTRCRRLTLEGGQAHRLDRQNRYPTGLQLAGTKGKDQMTYSRIAIGKQALKYAMVGITLSCLGAAVFAAPLTVTPKAKVAVPAQQSSAKKSAFAPLAQGPAFQLGRAGAGEEEDCVKVTRITGPDGRIYVTRGLICQE